VERARMTVYLFRARRARSSRRFGAASRRSGGWSCVRGGDVVGMAGGPTERAARRGQPAADQGEWPPKAGSEQAGRA